MPIPFNTVKDAILLALTSSKLSALVPLVERVALTQEYTNWQYAPQTNDEPAAFIKNADPWLAQLFLCVAYDLLGSYPDYYPAPPQSEIILPPNTPYVLHVGMLPEVVYTYRKVDYTASIIKNEIARYLNVHHTESQSVFTGKSR
jgi:hypothetical protein